MFTDHSSLFILFTTQTFDFLLFWSYFYLYILIYVSFASLVYCWYYIDKGVRGFRISLHTMLSCGVHVYLTIKPWIHNRSNVIAVTLTMACSLVPDLLIWSCQAQQCLEFTQNSAKTSKKNIQRAAFLRVLLCYCVDDRDKKRINSLDRINRNSNNYSLHPQWAEKHLRVYNHEEYGRQHQKTTLCYTPVM